MATRTRSVQKRPAIDSWHRPELRPTDYRSFGDAYDDEIYQSLAQQWGVKDDRMSAYPYMTWVKRLSESGWTHLNLLVDFMSIGTVPQNWPRLNAEERVGKEPPTGNEMSSRKIQREQRIKKTTVCILDYFSDDVEATEIFTADMLKEELRQGDVKDGVQFRLYVVEDLSREVVEALGHNLGIEPEVFRAHIVDFTWYNIRDRWRDPPLLGIPSKRENWFQLRYIAVRYFDTDADDCERNSNFERARQDELSFNISRRLDQDRSNKSFWDKDKSRAIVGLTRSKATLWLQPRNDKQNTAVGVLLLDPTVSTGVPLWRGRRTLWPTPKYGEPLSKVSLPQNNVFEDFIFWARQRDLYPHYASGATPKGLIPLHVLLHFVCAEWLTIVDYIKTKLYQLEWEIDRPQHFTIGNQAVDDALKKLHIWRRLVSLYREMLSETLRNMERLSERTRETFSDDAHLEDGAVSGSASTPKGQTERSMPPETEPSLTSHYEQDFSFIQSQLSEYQHRIDRLTAVVTGIISIEDSRRSIQDNHNIGRLTWLATIFIPLSLISGILSMQSDVSEISTKTFTVYFATALPLALVIAAGARILSASRSQYKTHKNNKTQRKEEKGS
ncbi:hypothetical protein F5Y17DRAFT_301615 [Xylariaceae sp. FL0594]|nr:hypothetical protein F5Y17DRAFT_301615 [Xylariaceae sp. FL0594]